MENKLQEFNSRSDFKLKVNLLNNGNVINPRDLKWTIAHYIVTSKKVIASYDGTTLTNCKINGNDIICVFDNHNLGVGRLMREVILYIEDDAMLDGIRKEVKISTTNYRLTNTPCTKCEPVEITDNIDFSVTGTPGKDAYEVWLTLPGNAGKTKEEFFDSFKGTAGDHITIENKNFYINGNDTGIKADYSVEFAEFSTMFVNLPTYVQESILATNNANATNDSVQVAENLRVSAESSRVTAESNRVTQENDRIDAENGRVAAEAQRQIDSNTAVNNANNAAAAANTAAQEVENLLQNIQTLPQSTLYLNSGNTLTPTAPTIDVTLPITLNGTTPSVIDLTYTAPDDGFISLRSTYNPAFYVKNLNTIYTYNVKLEWFVGATKIVEASQSVKPSGTNVLFTFPMTNNILTANIDYLAGQVFTLRATISKDGVPNQTIEVYSISGQRSGFTRNGGAIGSGEIVDFNGINTKTQSQRNREYETDTNLYNVTLAIPLTAGQYYTEVEARSVVPIDVRKKGLIITFEIASNIWLRQQFTGDPTIEWDIPLKWKSLTDSFVTETHLSTITLPTIGKENVLYMIGENSNTSEIYIYEKDHYKQITWNYNNLEIINGGHA